MRYLILGGAGFIGRNLAAALIQSGHQVSILDNYCFSDPIDNPDIKTYTGDVLNESIVSSCINSFNPDIIIWSLAFHAYLPGTQPIVRQSWTAYGLAKILPVIGHIKPRRFVLISSDTVYKPSDKTLKETSVLNWGSPQFAIAAKIMMEWYTTSICKYFKIPFLIVRLPYIFGNRKYIHPTIDPISFYIDSMFYKQNILVVEAQQKRDYLSIDNATAMLTNLVTQEKFYNAYNISSGQGITNRELIQAIASKIQPNILPSFVEGKEADYVLDNKKIQSLGQVNIHSVLDNLNNLIEFRTQSRGNV